MLTLLLGFIVLLLPESLVPSPRSTSQAANTSASQMRSRKYSLLTMKSKFISLCRGLVAPLVIFVPRRTNQRSRKDYNVTFVGLAIFIYSIASVSIPLHSTIIHWLLSLQGVYPVKYIYAKRTYSWTEIEVRVSEDKQYELTGIYISHPHCVAGPLYVPSLDITSNQFARSTTQ